MVKENCGVVGIFSLSGTNVVPMAIDALRALQHRGQEAWGIAIPNKPPLKRLGLVSAASSEFKTIKIDSQSQNNDIQKLKDRVEELEKGKDSSRNHGSFE